MDRVEKLCIEKGMRMTDQRRVIAQVLSTAHDHPDVEELYRRAHDVDPHISIATVYRTVRSVRGRRHHRPARLPATVAPVMKRRPTFTTTT